MEICTIRKSSFPMQSTIVANTFDGHISSCRNNSMVWAKDFVGHFRNGIFGKCRHYSVMLDCCLIQICFQGNENWYGFRLKFQTDLYFAVQRKKNEKNKNMERNEHIHAEIKFVRNFEKSNIQREQNDNKRMR